MAISQNSINNTVTNNNFTVPAGSISASGNITSTTGNISATLGSLNAGTTATAGTGITSTTGNITASAGNVVITAGNLTLPDTNTGGTQGEITFGTNTVIQNYPTGSANFVVGFLAGTTAVTNVSSGNNGFGGGVFNFVTSGGSNTAMGHVTLQSVTTGSNNSAFGAGASYLNTTGGNNTAVGYQAAMNVQTGNSNISLGYQAGNSWGSAVSNNIAIGNVGSAADSGRIRIGTNATHTSCFITGIDGVNVGSVAKVVTLASDQLGTATITAGTGITVTPGANTITIASSGTTVLTYTTVNTTPYVVLTTDDFLGVDSSGAPIQINLPNAPTTGRVITIKDTTGSANTNNITVTTVGGAVLIDAAATYVMNTQYAAIDVLFNGTKYLIF